MGDLDNLRSSLPVEVQDIMRIKPDEETIKSPRIKRRQKYI